MNWSKAKNILIVLFIIVNMLLISNIIYIENEKSNSSDNSTLADVTDYLKDHHISLNTPVPKKTVLMPYLIGSQKLYSVEEIIKLFFNDSKDVTIKYNTDGKLLSYEGASVILTNDNALYYKNTAIKENAAAQNRGTEEACQAVIDAFLEGIGIEKNMVKIESKNLKNDSLHIRYSQKYSRWDIYKSYIDITAHPSGVADAQIHWLQGVRRADSSKQIFEPYDLLYRLAYSYTQEENKTPLAISSMDQGYYWNHRAGLPSGESGFVEETVVPVWRFRTNKGDIYMNIYTGKRENEGL